MKVQFTPDQESRLSKVAASRGTRPEQLVKAAALRLLKSNARTTGPFKEEELKPGTARMLHL
jgi:hypothetical protein